MATAPMSDFRSLRETMERCSEIVAEAYALPIETLEMYTGELPAGHRSTDRRQRYFVKEHNGDMFVALPGTTHPMDWSSNLRVNYKPVDGSDVPVEQLEEVPCAHAGFYYRTETVPTLQLLQQAAERGCRLVLTGHSLGGAVANLCTLKALQEQKRALAAAADAATAAARVRGGGGRRRSKAKAKARLPAAGGAGVGEPLSPQAALTEVLCVSFASPLFANAALSAMVEDNGWADCFVNVVVPEDYCLKLFNNVLTSAPQPEGASLSRSASSSSFRASQQQRQTEYSELLDDDQEVPEAFMPDEASSGGGGAVAAAPQPQPRYSYTGGQQPLASALAGKKLRGSARSKQQLSFAHPVHEMLEDAGEQHEATADKPLPPPLAIGRASSAGWVEEAGGLPSSPSCASLLSEGSMSSTRSWTLLAYLPEVLTRSFSNRSLGGDSSGDSDSGAPEGWGMRHARSAADLSRGMSLASSSGSDSSNSLCDLEELAVPFVSAGFVGADEQQQQEQEQQQQQQQVQPPPQQVQRPLRRRQQRSLRRSLSSASLTLIAEGQRQLAARMGDSLALVSSLLPSMRSMAGVGRAALSVASNVADRTLSVPLTVLEAGLIKALRPPMYQPVGQQWILSATGLVPQNQPIQHYPRHVHDVFWHKELMLVAFREHSIVFYKQRLLKQASRR